MLVQQTAGVVGQEIHSEMDPFKISPFNGQVPRLGGAGAEHDRIVIFQLFGGKVDADVRIVNELDTLGFHLTDASQDDLLLIQFHIGNAVHEQAARAIGAFEYGSPVASSIQLSGSTKPRRAGSDHGNFFAGAELGRFGQNPALFPAFVNNGALDGLDADRGCVDAKDARALTRSRTDATRELGKIIGLMQTIERFFPQTAIYQVIPFRNQIMNRATRSHPTEKRSRVAKRNPTIHAPRALLAKPGLGHVVMKFIPILNAFHGGTVKRQFAKIFDEAGGFTHGGKFRTPNAELQKQSESPGSKSGLCQPRVQ